MRIQSVYRLTGLRQRVSATNEAAQRGGRHARTRTLVGTWLVAATTVLSLAVRLATAQCPERWLTGAGQPMTDSSVLAMAALPDGNVVVGGTFNTVGGVTMRNIARYGPSTNTWHPLSGEIYGIFRQSVRAIAVLPGGDLIVGGEFIGVDGVQTSNIARYSMITSAWTSIGGVTGNGETKVTALAVLPSGDVIVGGNFNAAGNIAARGVARYTPSTNTWTAMGDGLGGGRNETAVYALAVRPTGDVIVGGQFRDAGGIAVNNVASYTPSTNSWSTMNAGFDEYVYSLAIMPSGEVLAGGSFGEHLSRYSPVTNSWSTMGKSTGGNWKVNTIAVLPNGEILKGSSGANTLAIYNPNNDNWPTLGGGVNGSVFAVASLPDGGLLVGGSFFQAGGSGASNIARYSFGTPSPTVTVQPPAVSGCVTSSVTLTASVTNAGPLLEPLTYQWRASGIPINPNANPSAATSTLTLNSIELATAGEYDCVITSPCATATSNAATLEIGTPPSAAAVLPQSMTACQRSTVTLAATATGTAPFTYQWRRAGIPIDVSSNASAASDTLQLTRIQFTDAGSYDCVVSNQCGTTTSNPATLSTRLCLCLLADVAGGGDDGQEGDGIVDGSDFIAFINSFATGDVAVDPRADIVGGGLTGLDPDGIIDGSDFIMFINTFSAGC